MDGDGDQARRRTTDGHFARSQQQADVLRFKCPRSFVSPDGLELVSYPWYRPIKKPAAYREPIGRVRPPWRLQLANLAESPMVTVYINNIYGRYFAAYYPMFSSTLSVSHTRRD